MFRIVFASIVSLVLSGCFLNNQALVKKDENVDENKGVLLTSVTTAPDRWVMNAWFFYKAIGDEKEWRLDAFADGILWKIDDFPNIESKEGRLLAVPLDPGEYELTNWTLYVRRLGGYGYIEPKIAPQPIGFSISPGQITYLGNLHIEPVLGKNVFGVKMPFGALPIASSQLEIDKLLVHQKYSGINGWPIQMNVPEW